MMVKRTLGTYQLWANPDPDPASKPPPMPTTPRQTYGEYEFERNHFLITSPEFASQIASELPLGPMHTQSYSESFLGKDVMALMSPEGRIVGWDKDALNKFNGENQ